MDTRVEAVLAKYFAREAAERQLFAALGPGEGMRRRDEFLIPVGPDVGRLLNILVRESRAKKILELGTSYGYSTIFLAEAAQATGGEVITTEISANKADVAQAALAEAGLAQFVEIRLGDARDTIAAIEHRWDFVLVDLWKELYVACAELFYPKLAAGAIVVADNMTHPEAARPEAQAYQRYIRGCPHVRSVFLPVGNGIEISRYEN